MKCYFCEDEARGICTKCGRGVCKGHGEVSTQQRAMTGKSYNLVCGDCVKGMETGNA
ncbi:MAG: hypothetical protein ACYC7D_12815 [Nitrososphaerales archaeon]